MAPLPMQLISPSGLSRPVRPTANGNIRISTICVKISMATLLMALGACASLASSSDGPDYGRSGVHSSRVPTLISADLAAFLSTSTDGQSAVLPLAGGPTLVAAGTAYYSANGRECRFYRMSITTGNVDARDADFLACQAGAGWQPVRSILAKKLSDGARA